MAILEQNLSNNNASTEQFAARRDVYQQRVNALLERQIEKASVPGETLTEALRYAVLSGGKRVRPLFSYASAELAGASLDAADVVAASVELIHAYSLVHDDLPAMDDDDLRRGQPTVHVQFDEAAAVLAGDALNTMAFELLANPPGVELPAELRCRLIQRLAVAAGAKGMVGGQGLDMAYTGQLVDKQSLEGMFARKTGEMIAAAIMMAADCGTLLSDTSYSDLERYSKLAGLCFQIHDDVLDVTQTDDVLGKPAGSDTRNDRSSYPARFGLEATQTRATELLEESLGCLHRIGPEAEGLIWLTEYIVSRDH